MRPAQHSDRVEVGVASGAVGAMGAFGGTAAGARAVARARRSSGPPTWHGILLSYAFAAWR